MLLKDLSSEIQDAFWRLPKSIREDICSFLESAASLLAQDNPIARIVDDSSSKLISIYYNLVYPDGQTRTYQLMYFRGGPCPTAIVIASVKREREEDPVRIVCVHEHRLSCDGYKWGFPSGCRKTLEKGQEEDILDAANREMLEESGYIVLHEKMRLLGMNNPHTALRQSEHVFLARDAVPDPRGRKPETNENITEVSAFTKEETEKLIRAGDFHGQHLGPLKMAELAGLWKDRDS